MTPWLDILTKLNEGERSDLTAWFSKLSKKEQESVASVLTQTSLERIRLLLSVSADERIPLFLVEKSISDKTGDTLSSFIRWETERTAEGLERANQRVAEHRRRWSGAIKPRRHWHRRGFLGRLLGIDIPF